MVEPPSVTGPLMVTLPPEILTVPAEVCVALVEVLAAMFRPVAPMSTVPPEILSVPVEVPVWAPVPVLRRSATLTAVASRTPAPKLTVALTFVPSVLMRPPILRELSRRSAGRAAKSARMVGLAPVLLFIQPTFMTARPVPARLRTIRLPCDALKNCRVAPPRSPPSSMALTLRVLTPVPRRRTFAATVVGEVMFSVAATIVLVGARVISEPAPPPALPLPLAGSPIRKVPPARPA